MLLLVASLAQATEIGNSKLMGFGANTGTSLEGTGKYWLSERTGVAVFAGLMGWRYLDVRGQFERDIFVLHDWPWGELSVVGDAGVQFDIFPTTVLGKAGVGIGPYAGAMGRILFHEYPVEVFTGPDIGVRWVSYTDIQPIEAIVHWNLGGRWYF